MLNNKKGTSRPWQRLELLVCKQKLQQKKSVTNQRQWSLLILSVGRLHISEKKPIPKFLANCYTTAQFFKQAFRELVLKKMAAQSALDSASAPKKDAPAANNDELLDYEEEEMQTFSLADAKSTNKKALAAASTSAANAAGSASVQQIKGAYSSIHSSSFRDFLLKPELMHAIQVSGFEHPSTGIFKYS